MGIYSNYYSRNWWDKYGIIAASLAIVFIIYFLSYGVIVNHDEHEAIIKVAKLEVGNRGYHATDVVYYVHVIIDGENKMFIAQSREIYEHFEEGKTYTVLIASSTSIGYGNQTYITNIVEQIGEQNGIM